MINEQEDKEILKAAITAERNLLGSIMIEAAGQKQSGITAICRNFVMPGDFHDARFADHRNARIYTAMLKCQIPEETSVIAQLIHDGQLVSGDMAELAFMKSEVPCWMDWEIYAHAIREYSRARNGGELPPRVRGGCIL